AVGERQEGLGFAIPVGELAEALAKAEKQTGEEEQTVIRHHLAAAFLRLARAGKIRGEVMRICSAAIQRGMQRGILPNDALDRMMSSKPQGLREEMKQIEKQLDELEPVLRKLRASKLLAEEVRSG